MSRTIPAARIPGPVKLEPPLGSYPSPSVSVWDWLRRVSDVTEAYRPIRGNAQLNIMLFLPRSHWNCAWHFLFIRKFKFVCTRAILPLTLLIPDLPHPKKVTISALERHIEPT